ncbi:MAG TPA: hypothetical protein VEX35_12105 [Allosphingosinicella sp.]|nr:hypothetical protein [Allosphingosinicella sp.]
MDVNSSQVALIDDSDFSCEEELISDESATKGKILRRARTLTAATRELERVNRTLRRIAGTAAQGRAAADSAAADARAIIAARRQCQLRFGLEIGDVAWVLLLEAFAARSEGRPLATTSLGAAGGITRTTAYRWTRRLLARGLLSGETAPHGKRATFVTLSDDAAEGIRASLVQARALAARAG